MTILGLSYLALHLFPQTLFAHSVTVGRISVYSRHPLPEQATSSVERAIHLLDRSELFEGDRNEKIYVCDSPALFRLFSPKSPAAFGISVPITNNVFLASADFASDTVRRFGDRYNTRSLSGVIAHELTHGHIRGCLGLIPGMRLSAWRSEGYCEHVAGEGSFPDEKGMQLFLTGDEDESAAYRYFMYRMIVSYLIDHRGLSFDELVDGSVDFDDAKSECRQFFLKTSSLQDGEP